MTWKLNYKNISYFHLDFTESFFFGVDLYKGTKIIHLGILEVLIISKLRNGKSDLKERKNLYLSNLFMESFGQAVSDWVSYL